MVFIKCGGCVLEKGETWSSQCDWMTQHIREISACWIWDCNEGALIFPWCFWRMLQSHTSSVSSSLRAESWLVQQHRVVRWCSSFRMAHAEQGQEVCRSSAGSVVGQRPCSRMAAGWNRGLVHMSQGCAPPSLVLSSQMRAALCCTQMWASGDALENTWLHASSSITRPLWWFGNEGLSRIKIFRGLHRSPSQRSPDYSQLPE